MAELNDIFAQILPHASTRYIACYGVVFAPRTTTSPQHDSVWIFFCFTFLALTPSSTSRFLSSCCHWA